MRKRPMTNPKRARVQQQHQHARSNPNTSHGTGKKHRKMSSFAKISTNNNHGNSNSGNKEKAPAGKNERHQQKQPRRPIVPFRRTDRILLVGEGNFSFAHSLAKYHRCRHLVATCYDSKKTLYIKFPQAEKNIADILNSPSKPKDGETQGPKVLFSVDAKKLGSGPGGGKDVRFGYPRKERKVPDWKKEKKSIKSGRDNEQKDKGGPWDVICFNFPHVGGLTTDVNRQVRANQELLVAFFKACVPLLSERLEAVDYDDEEEEEEEHAWGSDADENGTDEGANEKRDYDDGAVKAKDERRTEPGQILVTLFEGEPYTLWNIKDLARHAGLRVVTSFKFPWACYRGYSHARTLGEVEGKDGGRGGWRGEDREARTYVFELKTDDHAASGTTGKRKKRSTETDESESD